MVGINLEEVGGVAGPACLTLSLSPGVPTSSKLPASQLWVAVGPDALSRAQLIAGQHVLVGIVDVAPTAAAAGLSSSGRLHQPHQPTTPTSTFAPVQLPDLPGDRTFLTDLWDSTCSMCGVRVLAPPPAPPLGAEAAAPRGTSAAAERVPVIQGCSRGAEDWGTADGMSGRRAQRRGREDGDRGGVEGLSSHQQHPHLQQPDGQQGQQQQQQQQAGQLGRCLLAVRVWPCARVPRGCAALSSGVAEACGRPQPGASALVLHRMPQPLQAVPVCHTLVLQVCHDAVRCKPASLPAQPARPSPSTPGRRGDTPSRALMQAGGSGGGGGAATPPQPARNAPHILSEMTTPLASQQHQQHQQPATPSSNPAAASQLPPSALSAVPLGDWVLDLLTPPSVATSSRNSAGSSNGSGGNSSNLTDEQRGMLGNVAARHLCGRVLLAGNPILLPLLGHTLLCRMAAATAAGREGKAVAASQGAAAGAAAGRGLDLEAWQVVAGSTQVVLLLEGEPLPEEMAAQLAPSSSKASQDQSQALPAWAAGRSLGQLVALARQAAEEEVQGSGAQAAAGAAERALRGGLAAHSTLGFQALGGVAHYVTALRELVALPLRAPHLFAGLRVRPPRGVLLHGPPGGGKTVLARAAAADAGAALLVVNGPDVVSEFFGESEAGLRGVFAAAKRLSPAVVFIDEVDALAPARGGGGDGGSGLAGALSGSTGGAGDSASRLVTVLLTLMDGAGGAGPGDGVVVIAATNRPNALDAALRRPGRFERELEVGVPGPQARADVLRARLRQVPNQSLQDADIEALAAAAHGYVGADLAALVNEAALVALRRAVGPQRAALCVTREDFTAAEARVRPSALRELAVEVPHVGWGDVGGLEEVKQRLREAVEWPFRMPGALARMGAQAPRGILLYGPPGCSKTLLARAVACEAKLNFLAIKGGELYSKHVGESERAVAALFARARATAPCIVFFDEIDGLAGTRSDDSAGGHVGDRVMAQLLSEMDGLQDRLGVVVLAATNRPDCVDPALLRPGRFDRLVHVPPPDAYGRKQILEVKLRNTPVASDVDIVKLASSMEGYTGADIGALVREAGLAALDEDIAATHVSWRHFEKALEMVPASAPSCNHLLDVYRHFDLSSQ